MHMVHDVNLASLDLNLLVVLRALLTERHVTRAAARVGLSQSATSHALSRLRELYDDPLLVRSSRSLVLTPRAERLLPTLERGLSDLTAAIAGEPAFDPATARRTFTLGMADYTQAVLLGSVVQALEYEAPQVDLRLSNPQKLQEQVVAGNVDLGVDTSTNVPAEPLSSRAVFDDDFVCLVRANHPRVGERLSLADYLGARHVVVAPSGTSGSLVDTELGRLGLERHVALRVANFLVALVVISETDLVSTMPRRLALGMAERYQLRLLPPPIALPHFGFSLIWHPRLDHDPAQRWLRDLVARVCRQVGAVRPGGEPGQMRRRAPVPGCKRPKIRTK